jgi:hypothetical protein
MKAVPRQKRHESKQDVGTPRPFIHALERRFGPVAIDLAAHEGNHVVDRWFGPGGEHPDSLALSCVWRRYNGLLWLNPPFANIAPWAHNCAVERHYGALIGMLTPASIATDWFKRYVLGQALVLAVMPRITFVGNKTPYPKDLMLTLYGRSIEPGFGYFDWRDDSVRSASLGTLEYAP